MSVLKDHHAFVTGSTQGIGLEIAKALCEAGAGVVLHGRRTDGESLRQARSQNWLPASVPIVLGDLTEPMPQGPLDVAEDALRVNPNIDMLVCNAGTFIDQPFLEMDFHVFDRTLKLNVYSQYVLIQHFARLWVRRGIRGRILLIGSINGHLSEPTHVAYDTSKGAIDAMTRSLCVSLAPHGIRVNGMAPGLIRTPLTEPALQTVDGIAYAKRRCSRCRSLPRSRRVSAKRCRRTYPRSDAPRRWRDERLATTRPAAGLDESAHLIRYD